MRPPTTGCPDNGCDNEAVLIEWFTLESTDGPCEHAVVRCRGGHCFALPLDMLERAKRKSW